MANTKKLSKKPKKQFATQDNKPVFQLDQKDADLLKAELSEDFVINDHLLRCVEHFGKTLLESLSMNACMASCMSDTPEAD